MITFNPQISSRSNFFELTTKRYNNNAYQSINDYSNKSTTNTTATSSTGSTSNTAASSTNSTNSTNSTSPTTNTKMACDYSSQDIQDILKEMQLENPENRFHILCQLNTHQLNDLVPLLDKNQLATGLKFFDKTKLRDLIFNLPQDKILKMLGSQVTDKQKIIAMMPMKSLKELLDSNKIQKDDYIKMFQALPLNILAKISESATGQPAGKRNKQTIVKDLSKLDKDYLKEGTKTLPNKEFLTAIGVFMKQNDDLYNELPKAAVFKPFETMTKPCMIDSAKSLDPDDLTNMIGQLPNNFVALTLTQMDPNLLAYQLQKNEKDLLISLDQ